MRWRGRPERILRSGMSARAHLTWDGSRMLISDNIMLASWPIDPVSSSDQGGPVPINLLAGNSTMDCSNARWATVQDGAVRAKRLPPRSDWVEQAQALIDQWSPSPSPWPKICVDPAYVLALSEAAEDGADPRSLDGEPLKVAIEAGPGARSPVRLHVEHWPELFVLLMPCVWPT